MGSWRVLKKVFSAYVVVVLTAVPLAGVGVLAYAVYQYRMPPLELAQKALDKARERLPWLADITRPAPRFLAHELDGRIKTGHPRILLPELSSWVGVGPAPYMSARLAEYQARGIRNLGNPCGSKRITARALCWVMTGDVNAGRQALNALTSIRPNNAPSDGAASSLWPFAVAYDLLALHPEMTNTVRSVVEEKLEVQLRRLIESLDDPQTSMYHRRTTWAADAWLLAVVLTPGDPKRDNLVARAQAHFLDVMRAISLTEAWPEGYNYWIQSRALPVALAGAAYVNGLEGAKNKDALRSLLERIGLWHVYATRPNNQIEGFGDEGSRVDLKDETRRVIDVLVQVTKSPILSGYSRFLAKTHGRSSYYRGYRWQFPLFNDPTIAPWPGTESGELEPLEFVLPKAEIFGLGYFNMAYIRSGWGQDDTFISFRAGKIFAHHGHYDAGHFTLFKGRPLAVNSSTYGKYTGANRLNYSIRTIAKNSLLILRPGERVQPNRFFKENVADGGQRIVLPTGSAVSSVADWLANVGAGKHFEAGEIVRFDFVAGSHAYIAADLTDAYNTPGYDDGGSGGKVRRVARELLYLFDEDMLLIHDDVITTDARFTKKWLLHTLKKPTVENARIRLGTSENGILESRETEALIQDGESTLRLVRLLPEDGIFRLVGGPDYRYYVESDGDDSDLDGKNMAQGAKIARWFDNADWRIEIQPVEAKLRDHFLVALLPNIGPRRSDRISRLRVREGNLRGVETPSSVVVFVGTEGPRTGTFEVGPEIQKVYMFGFPARSIVEYSLGQGFSGMDKSTNGALVVRLDYRELRETMTIKW